MREVSALSPNFARCCPGTCQYGHTVGMLMTLALPVAMLISCLSMAPQSDALRAIDDADLQARRMGVEGVPFFIFNRRYAVSGAQEAQALVEAMIASTKPDDTEPAQPA